MDKPKQFTIADGIHVQRGQLKQWKKVLKPKFYIRLHKYAVNQASALDPVNHTGHMVFRGTDLDSFIHNNLILENGFYKED